MVVVFAFMILNHSILIKIIDHQKRIY